MMSRRMFGMLGLSSVFIAGMARAADPFGRDAQFLRSLGRPLRTPQPIGDYLPARRSGQLLYLSTVVARTDGTPDYRGLVGRDLSLEQAQLAARATALALLEVVAAELGTLDAVAQIVNIIGYVASADGFTRQSDVMDGASAALIDVLGYEAGRTSRSAVGVTALSRNAAIAISGVVEVRRA